MMNSEDYHISELESSESSLDKTLVISEYLMESSSSEEYEYVDMASTSMRQIEGSEMGVIEGR